MWCSASRTSVAPCSLCQGRVAPAPPVPPQRASIPVLALEAQPPTELPSRPTCRGAGPLQVLKTRDSRATPGRPARSDQSTTPTSQWPLEGYRDSNPRSPMTARTLREISAFDLSGISALARKTPFSKEEERSSSIRGAMIDSSGATNGGRLLQHRRKDPKLCLLIANPRNVG